MLPRITIDFHKQLPDATHCFRVTAFLFSFKKDCYSFVDPVISSPGKSILLYMFNF